MGLDFGLILLGESFRIKPEEFPEAHRRLPERILHFGYAKDAATYSRLLWQADVCVSTAHHEFFGAATLEAIYCGCFPILPNRLAYPEIIPPQYRLDCLYDDFKGLLTRLRGGIINIEETRQKSLRSHVERYDWATVAPVYDSRLESILKAEGSSSKPHYVPSTTDHGGSG
jgi:glycosyltransferase involved in cell wall biosynthesis